MLISRGTDGGVSWKQAAWAYYPPPSVAQVPRLEKGGGSRAREFAARAERDDAWTGLGRVTSTDTPGTNASPRRDSRLRHVAARTVTNG